MTNKILDFAALSQWRADLRKNNKKLAVTNGVFDLLHRGHVQYLAEAAAFADELLICINDDAGVRELKGAQRPIVKAEDRAYLLASLGFVSRVLIFQGTKATEALTAAEPDVYVKGGDYNEESLDQEEYAVLKKVGSEIKFIPFIGNFSTTGIVEKLQEDKKSEFNTGLNPELMHLYQRRSIRKYQDKEIDEQLVDDLLQAAMAAPSAVTNDPWEFIVISDKELKNKISEILPYGKFLANAPLGIIVCGNFDKAHQGELSYLLQDCSAACQNLLLAVSALKLGACWLGIHPREDRIKALNELFKLPENIIPIAGFAIGWPAENKEARTRYNKELVHINKW